MKVDFAHKVHASLL